jgi:hypothetical protein
VVYQGPHLPVEKRQEQRPYVRSVHVRIGHYDDLVVSYPGDVEIDAQPAADGDRQVPDLLVVEELAGAGLFTFRIFRVWAVSLEVAVPPLFGGPSCRISSTM